MSWTNQRGLAKYRRNISFPCLEVESYPVVCANWRVTAFWRRDQAISGCKIIGNKCCQPPYSLGNGSSQIGMGHDRRPSLSDEIDFLHSASALTGSLSAISPAHAVAAPGPAAMAALMVLLAISPCTCPARKPVP
jgi:hypothetical protein